MNIKRTFGIGLVSASALLGGIAAAEAADIYRGGSMKDVPAAAAPGVGCCAFTWNGFYIGSNFGASFPNNDFRNFDHNDGWWAHDNNAEFIGGFHLGYNWQTAGFAVLGIEGDVDFSDTVDHLASIRARLGFAYDRALIYVTGGAAFVGLNDDFFDDHNHNYHWNDDNATGWVFGGGIETKITPAYSVGLETLFYSFNDTNFHYLDGNSIHDCDNSLDLWTVRARLTWHFNRGDYDVLR